MAARATLPILFIGASFLSATLLFSVQPMFTKLVLPVLGGSASVWSIAMVFFQTVLLLGYAYAHGLARFLAPRRALVLHLGVAVLTTLTLPVTLPSGDLAQPDRYQALWLLSLFAASVGLPFFWLSANGPLLQAWFARTGGEGADQPYSLYAASNVGSFAALLAYPLVIEPFVPLGQQTVVWAGGFMLLMFLLAPCGLMARSAVSTRALENQRDTADPVLTWRKRAKWIALAFVPSGLLVSVTAHISTDVAAVPLLWVAPLALFLLTFIVAFRDRPDGRVRRWATVQVWATVVALFTFVVETNLWLVVLAHLVAFFVNASVCHIALYRLRPAARDLTEFYLFMSLGGCLGGMFAALAAPMLFSGIFEYPLLLALALSCRPGFWRDVSAKQVPGMVRLGLLCGSSILVAVVLASLFKSATPQLLVVVGLGAVLLATWRIPARALPLAASLALAVCLAGFGPTRVETVRSFFGVHKIDLSSDGRFLTLSHGTTIHGAIRRLNDDGSPASGRPEPTTYYTYDGALGSAVRAVRRAQSGLISSVAAVGLGSGNLACHSAPGEHWSFFEIDPEIVSIARDPSLFRFLSECAPNAPIEIGDARLTLPRVGGRHDLIVIDAFSSDAIPSHLITREAMGLYRSLLEADGVLLVHISNRHLDLTNIIARAAAEIGWVAYEVTDRSNEPAGWRLRTPSQVMALARSPDDLGSLASDGVWHEVTPDMTRRPWTDDFSNIIEAIADKTGWRWFGASAALAK